MARLREAAIEPTAQEASGSSPHETDHKDETSSESADDHASTRGSPSEGVGGEETKAAADGVPGVGRDDDAGRGEGRATTDAEDDWVEETVEHPAPDYGVESPVIRCAVVGLSILAFLLFYFSSRRRFLWQWWL